MSAQDTDSVKSVSDALAPFGWDVSADREFWQRYHSDAWVYNLTNAVVRLSTELDRAQLTSISVKSTQQIGWAHKDATGRWFFHADDADHLGCRPVFAPTTMPTDSSLEERIAKAATVAEQTFGLDAAEVQRLRGKAEGLRLALSYVKDAS